MFALVDCNNFYANCERVFQPEWRKAPIAVLSNNDGCIVARSDEAKNLGYRMGVPYFQVKNQFEQDGVIVRSSNYALYGDLSQRVMECLKDLALNVEVYSIDEAFLDLHGISNLENHGRKIIKTVKQWTSIPTSIGIAPSKTLAKIANRMSKKNLELANVCVLKPPFSIDNVQIEDVWGIGRALSKRLRLMGIGTAQDLANLSPHIARKKFSVTVERTVHELRGESVITLEEEPPTPKQIIVSRGFGETITDKKYIEQAVTMYTSRAAEKARKKNVYAGVIHIFLKTSRFANSPYHMNSASWTLPEPSNDDLTLVRSALTCLDSIWRVGFAYSKAEIRLTELTSTKHQSASMFQTSDKEAHQDLMHIMDRVNKRYGHGTLRTAATGIECPWAMARNFMSPHYTTRWEDLPIAKA